MKYILNIEKKDGFYLYKEKNNLVSNERKNVKKKDKEKRKKGKNILNRNDDVDEVIKNLEKDINEKLKMNNVIVRIIRIKDNNKAKIVIFKDKMIDKEYNIEVIASKQIKIIEKNKIIENGLFIDNLIIWIYNLYNPVEYLYEFYGGKLNNKVLTRQQIDKISNGLTRDYSTERKDGLLMHKKELNNQPTVEGYLGPMYNRIDYGKIYLKYETMEFYKIMLI